MVDTDDRVDEIHVQRWGNSGQLIDGGGAMMDTFSSYSSLLQIWNIVIFIKINMSIHLKC